MEKYLFSGKTEEEALEKALDNLDLTEKDVYYKSSEQKGGLFKAKKIDLEVIKKSDVDEFLKELVLKITEDMGFDIKLETKKRGGILSITLFSDNNNLLIGKEGKNLAALSTILKQAIYNEIGFFHKFSLDVGEYRLKQQQSLERMASRLAKDVATSKVEAKLEPMNSYDRRVIHNILNDHKDVYTESLGEEPNRCVVIKPRDN